MNRIIAFCRQRRGAAAAEFALVLPAFLFLTVGAINLSFLMYAVVSLHQATEAAARYASIQTTLGNTTGLDTAVSNYAVNHYQGPAAGATYACTPADCSASGCGHLVTGSSTYRFTYGIGNIAIPISAKGCFP